MSAAWLDKPTLRNINLSAKAGSLVTVVGPVGAGKSSLLMAILGELLPSSGSVTVEGPVGYASQEAWIMSDTIKSNITFGSKWDAEWYQQVVTACQFVPDLALFDAGSNTEVTRSISEVFIFCPFNFLHISMRAHLLTIPTWL
jgi:ATP-binding cassette subfamily C (CFTR/MRP) protein 4